MNTSPPSGFSSSADCTFAARAGKPLRMSVTPAAIQMRVPAGSPGLERLFDQLPFEFARKVGALARCLALTIHNLGHFGSHQNI
jgi:hypothetical protein